MESARRTSSLPSGVFRARSPQVEQALADGVAGVFLRHMSRLEADPGEESTERAADQRHDGDAEITPEDCVALLAMMREGSGAPPRLDEGIECERTWILLDLVVNGDTTARAAAVAELSDLAHAEPAFVGHDLAALRSLGMALDRIMARERPSLVFNALRRAVAAAVQRAEGEVT